MVDREHLSEDNGAEETGSDASRSPGTARRNWLIAAGAVVVIAAVAVTIGITRGAAEPEATGSSPSPTTTPTIEVSATPAGPTAAPEPEPEPEPTAVRVGVPSSCEQIYTPAMLTLLRGTGLDENHGQQTSGIGSLDPQLQALITATPHLTCTWGPPGEVGLVTNVTGVTEAQSADVLARMRATGFTCGEVAGGTRCSKLLVDPKDLTEEDREAMPWGLSAETDPMYSYGAGESAFLRDGLWVATHWSMIAPPNYTESIAGKIFGSAQ